MRIDVQNMPPLRDLNLSGAIFYKDVAPTALRFFAIMVLFAFLSGCKSPQQSEITSNLPVYGVANSNSIRITILGDVKKPGVYWVSQEVNLAQLSDLAGGWTDRGEFGIKPSRAIVTNPEKQKGVQKIFQIKALKQEEQERIHFENGDVVRFPMLLF